MAKDKKKNPSKRLPENWDDVGLCPQPFRGELRKIGRDIAVRTRAHERAVKILALKLDAELEPFHFQVQARVEALREQYKLDAEHKVDTASGRIIRVHDPRAKLVAVQDDICELSENADFADPDEDDPDEAASEELDEPAEQEKDAVAS